MGASGPLRGVRVLEMAGIGPAPFACMLLADMGADVLRIDRPEPPHAPHRGPDATNVTLRGRPALRVDLKTAEGVRQVRELAAKAHILIEGFRPGVMERLGLGPCECLEANPALVYGRMTGWGQDGPLAQAAGHDINYIAITGALHAIGPRDGKPVPPLNLVGDFGGGALYLALGVVGALFEARASGQGQVVDAAIVDGTLSMLGMVHGRMAAGVWKDERGANLLDGGKPWYDTYETADGKYVAIGAIEPQFYDLLCSKLGVSSKRAEGTPDFAAIFRSKTRQAWCELLEGTDACFAPVLTLEEARHHPHNAARGNVVEIGGLIQPAPAPRFSRTPGAVQASHEETGADRAGRWAKAC